jgi:hypothetical protein
MAKKLKIVRLHRTISSGDYTTIRNSLSAPDQEFLDYCYALDGADYKLKKERMIWKNETRLVNLLWAHGIVHTVNLYGESSGILPPYLSLRVDNVNYRMPLIYGNNNGASVLRVFLKDRVTGNMKLYAVSNSAVGMVVNVELENQNPLNDFCVGEILETSQSYYDPDGIQTVDHYNYQWFRSINQYNPGQPFTSVFDNSDPNFNIEYLATTSSYELQIDDFRHYVGCLVSAVDNLGQETAKTASNVIQVKRYTEWAKSENYKTTYTASDFLSFPADFHEIELRNIKAAGAGGAGSKGSEAYYYYGVAPWKYANCYYLYSGYAGKAGLRGQYLENPAIRLTKGHSYLVKVGKGKDTIIEDNTTVTEILKVLKGNDGLPVIGHDHTTATVNYQSPFREGQSPQVGYTIGGIKCGQGGKGGNAGQCVFITGAPGLIPPTIGLQGQSGCIYFEVWSRNIEV